MSEYKVKLVAHLGILNVHRGIEVYEADSAKEAMEKARADIRENLDQHGITEDEVKIAIEDVTKL